MTGYEDLDGNGTWTNVPEYGWGWQPRVAYGWAPYRYGHWRWVGPWGWTWVDEAAWGFAPFHYGRWACLHNSWYWFPGAYVTRPVYAPALVAFFGGANWGVSIGFGVGHVGWFPLAPGEVWMPHYHASYAYLHNVNHMHLHGRHVDYAHYDVSHGTYSEPGDHRRGHRGATGHLHRRAGGCPRRRRGGRARRDAGQRGGRVGFARTTRRERGGPPGGLRAPASIDGDGPGGGRTVTAGRGPGSLCGARARHPVERGTTAR